MSRLIINRVDRYLSFSELDLDSEVEIEMDGHTEDISMFIDKNAAQQIIDHLKKQFNL